jgi:cellulose synthase/poly-beta-1,6-N-acetylglucosamine synthase-like glycosyltransferase
VSAFSLLATDNLSRQGIFDGGNALEGFKKLLTTPEGLLVVAGLSIFFFYFFSSCLYRDPWHLLSSMPQVSTTSGTRLRRY